MSASSKSSNVVTKLIAAMVLSTTLSVMPALLSSSAHAESSESEQNRLNNFRKKGGVAGTPASDLSGASKVSTKTEIVEGQNVSPMLFSGSSEQLTAIASRYEEIVAGGGFPKVTGSGLKKGSKGDAVAKLNKRLFMDGYLRKEATEGEFTAVFTSATLDAVTRFQRNMGLNPSGKVDAATLAQLNVPADKRLRTLQANIARLQVYGQNLGDRYLVVNVPSQQLETVAGGKVFSRHNVIIGRPERPTPVVMAPLDNVSFNPYWNAPVSIVEKDIIPKIQSGSNIIEDLNIKIFDGFGGPEVDPKTVDWDNVTADRYFFREEPGPKSAMATAKINFNSPFGIYLHDTPEQQLFASSTRYYSSGCVRVEKMPMLVQWVINGQEGIGSSEISALAETLEQRVVTLVAPPQLRVTYLTAWPVGNTVAFRNDVYGLDGTGFVTGQPMPVGELSEDGQRFVLKPVPRKAAAVEAAEAEGFSIFGSRSKSAKKVTSSSGDENASTSLFGKPKKPGVAPTKVKASDGDAQIATSVKPKGNAAAKKNYSGLFDWDAYRKANKTASGKKVKPKGKPAAVTVAKAATPTPVIKPGAKPVAVAKAADPKVASPPKPVVKPKVIAASCKADASGKLPANCKTAAN